MRAAGGALDYQRKLYAFALPGADKEARVQMTTARSLVAAGLVTVTRTKLVGRREEPDRLELAAIAQQQLTPP